MATSPAETATLGWQSLTTVVTARDTDIDPSITDMTAVEDGVAMLGLVAGTHCESLMIYPDQTSITMTHNTATTRHALFSKISIMTDGGVPEVSHDGNQ
jgi:hypothetical protein